MPNVSYRELKLRSSRPLALLEVFLVTRWGANVVGRAEGICA